MKTCHLAIDIGASSGRHIVGWTEDGVMKLKETYRFENGLIEKNGHLCWDIEGLVTNVIAGIAATKSAGFEPAAIGIDTWAVDFVLLDENKKLIGDAVAYRDSRTDGIREKLEKEASGGGGITFAEQYARSGIQYQKFNTCYQLAALSKEHPEQLAAARYFLMIPDYLNYRLTGVIANEYTNASTTALVSAKTCGWDEVLIEKYGLPRSIFGEIRLPGTVLGELLPEVVQKTGFRSTVVLPATHDTGSAFLSVPARDDKAVFLSSGTWSLMGVENKTAITSEESAKANFTNEGGYEYRFRFLKNICGLWMIQSVRRELGEKTGKRPTFPELIKKAEGCEGFDGRVDPDDARFLAPKSMIREIAAALMENEKTGTGKNSAASEDGTRCGEKTARAGTDPVTGTPFSVGETMQTICNSLSDDYARTVKELEKLTGKTFTSLNIVGGGSQDEYLNQRTADATGLPVYAGPTEGTALGNLIVQWIMAGDFRDLADARSAVKKSFKIKRFDPKRR